MTENKKKKWVIELTKRIELLKQDFNPSKCCLSGPINKSVARNVLQVFLGATEWEDFLILRLNLKTKFLHRF